VHSICRHRRYDDCGRLSQSKDASIMPNVPTLTDARMTGYDAGIWIGLLAPAGTPSAIIEKLWALPTMH
jgi:tripartite-type tricarboxylate transporter receptor subunit TctC